MAWLGEKEWFRFLKQLGLEFKEDAVPRMSAALSYYTIFSLAPLLLIAIAVAGLAFGEEAARGEVMGSLEGLIGTQGAETIQEMVAAANRPAAGIIATVVSIAVLLFAASGVFGELQTSLNKMWDVEPKGDGGLLRLLKTRFLSFTMVLGVAFLLLVSLLVTAALSALGTFLSETLPGGVILWRVVNFLVSFAIITALFAVIFKYLPDAKVAWKDVWVGAAVTTALFVVGKFLIGLYLGRSQLLSAYGSAASLIIVLVWVYYSAMIFFTGGEFTQVYANRYGSRVRPDDDAKFRDDVRTRSDRSAGRPQA